MKETHIKTWEDLIACPEGSKIKIVLPSKAASYIIMVERTPDFLKWTSNSMIVPQRYTKENFHRYIKDEQWFLLTEEQPQQVQQVTLDDGTFCSCGGPSKRCDTGFSFSKVYFTCCSCKKEKRS